MTRRIQDQAWYYGLCSREMIEPLLAKQNRGAFLVRATQKGEKIGLALNVKNENSVDNFAIVFTEDNQYCLKAAQKEGKEKKCDSAVELIEYYRSHPLPNKLRLKDGVKRPHWLIAPHKVDYSKENKMGSGNFSDVYRGTVRRRQETIDCAIKVLHFDSEKKESDCRKRFLEEVNLQTEQEHENVVSMIGVVLDCPPIMMIMELCPGGSLDKHMQKRGTRIGDFEKLLYLFDSAMGMRFLHAKNVIHRDLAARNCLIGSNGRVKISDFGLSLSSPDGEKVTATMEVAPFRWMAPECLREKSFSFKTDVWAYGVLCFEVFSNGSKPFANYETDSATFRMIKAIRRVEMPPPPEGSPEIIQLLLKDIWQKDATVRPDFNAIIKRLGATLGSEKKPPAIAELCLSELPNVKLNSYPDFGWTENKERERQAKMAQEELEEQARVREKMRLKREEMRQKREGRKSRRSESRMGSTSPMTTTAIAPNKETTSARHEKNEKKAQGKWMTATIYKLMKNGKEDQVVEKKFKQETKTETGEPKSKNSDAKQQEK